MTIRELLTKELQQAQYINKLLKSTFEINRELQNHFADLYIMALDEPTEADCLPRLQNELHYITGAIAELAEYAEALQEKLDKVEALKKALNTPQIDEAEAPNLEEIPF